MCEMSERSARGDCPGDTMHLDQVCELPEHKSAPFCAGPSMKECIDGSEVPEDDECPGLLAASPRKSDGPLVPGWEEPQADAVASSNPCELDGTCDHTDEVVAVVGTSEPMEMLPETGLSDPMSALLLGLSTMVAGIGILYKAR